MRKLFLLVGLLVMVVMDLHAQNMSSPYSVYGVGEIQNTWSDRSSGMANTSISLMSTPGFLLNKNPASLIGLDRSMGQVDLGIAGRTTTFKGTPISSSNSSAHDVMINKFSLSGRLNNHWASSVGFTPFSYVSYSFTGQKSIEGSAGTYTGQYDGNGGLHNIFWNNAFAIGKHVAMGLRTSFIFGSINQIETLQGATLNVPIVSTVTNYYNNFRFEYGAIYSSKITSNWRLSLGGKVTTKSDLRHQQTLTVMEGAAVVEKDKDLGTGSFTLPWQYDAGMALINKGKATYTVDYSRSNWNGINPGGTTWAMVNSQRVSAGVQFSTQVNRFGMVAEKSYFQAGVFSGQDYCR